MTYDSHAWVFQGSQFIDTKSMPQREAARGAKRWRKKDANCPNES
jgi:hypothetical protein